MQLKLQEKVTIYIYGQKSPLQMPLATCAQHNDYDGTENDDNDFDDDDKDHEAGGGSSQSHTYVDFMALLKRSKKDLARTSAVFCIVYNRECSAYGTQCTVHLGHSALQSVRCAKHKAELLQPPEVNPASLHCIILII